MPLIDMPLEQLRSYTGRNPRPEDFDAYWEKAVSEMRGVDAKVEVTPAKFRASFATCYHLFFNGVGGARVHAKLLKPIRPRGSGVVVFHGYTGRSPDWYDLLQLAAEGHVVAALDCRGQAGMSQDVGGVYGNTHSGHIIRGLADGPEKLLYRSIFLDTAQLAGLVMKMEEVERERVGAMGGSQGGALAIACAALEPRVKRCAPTFPFLSDYLRVWEMDQAKQAYEELSRFFRHFDPTHEQVEEWFRRLGYVDIQHLAPRIKAKVLMACGLMDPICPPSTQFAAFNKMTCDKDVVIYPDFGHENLPGWNDRVFELMREL